MMMPSSHTRRIERRDAAQHVTWDWCPVCWRMTALRKDGTLWKHNRGYRARCKASGTRPADWKG